MFLWSLSNKIFHKNIRLSTGITISLYLATIWISLLFLYWGSLISNSYLPVDSELLIDNISIQITDSTTGFALIDNNITKINASIHAKTSSFDTGLAIIGIGLTFILFSLTMIFTLLNMESSYGNHERYDSYSQEYTSGCDSYMDSLNFRLSKIQNEIRRQK